MTTITDGMLLHPFYVLFGLLGLLFGLATLLIFPGLLEAFTKAPVQPATTSKRNRS